MKKKAFLRRASVQTQQHLTQIFCPNIPENSRIAAIVDPILTTLWLKNKNREKILSQTINNRNKSLSQTLQTTIGIASERKKLWFQFTHRLTFNFFLLISYISPNTDYHSIYLISSPICLMNKSKLSKIINCVPNIGNNFYIYCNQFFNWLHINWGWI